jgi:uncharacterized protein YraI
MFKLRVFAGVLLLALVPVVVSAFAQEQEQPLVVFIVDEALSAASPNDTSASGLSRLRDIFLDLGAEIQTANLEEALPEDADLIVLVGPRKPLSIMSLARLWYPLSQGSNLLLAVDPLAYDAVQTESASSGLSSLLLSDYGIGLHDTFLVEPWFTQESFETLENAYLRTYSDVVLHPIVAPLTTYDELPVQVWGARSIQVEPMGAYSVAVPLLYTDTAYGEANARSIVDYTLNSRGIRIEREQEPLEINIGQDALGRLNVGAVGENFGRGSRVAVLGDSEMLRNEFGLALDANTAEPLYLGNRLLAENIAAWLLEQPTENWPPLPSGFTWLAVDGDASDWDESLPGPPVIVTGDDDSLLADNDIRQVQTFGNESYLYLLLEPATSPGPRTYLTVGFDTSGDGAVDTTVSAGTGDVVLWNAEGARELISDARMAVGDVIELRLPLRITGINVNIRQLYISSSTRANFDADRFNSLSQPIRVPVDVYEHDPEDVRLTSGLLGTVSTGDGGANLRAGPGEGYAVVSALTDGQVVAILEEDENSSWLHIQTAKTDGWIARALVTLNGDFPTPTPTPDLGPVDAVVNADGAHLRFGPGNYYDIVSTASAGDKLILLGRNAGATWFRVQTRSGETAWISSTVIDLKVDPADIVIVEAPPTPTPASTVPAPSAGEPFNAWWNIVGTPREDIAANMAYHTIVLNAYGGSGVYGFYANGELLPSNIFEVEAPLCASLVTASARVTDTIGNEMELKIAFKSFCPTPVGCSGCELWRP